MMNRIEYNILKLYVIKFAKWFMLFMPIVKKFYTENDLSNQDLFVLQGIYSITIAILEIPSGYFADVWGRKLSMILGCALGVIGFMGYSFLAGFWGFLIAEFFLGVGESFISGADSAMLYDSLLDSKSQNKYVQQEGKITASGNFAEGFAAIIGGLIAIHATRDVFYVQTLIALVALFVSFTLVNPASHQLKLKPGLSDIFSIVKQSLFENKSLRYSILLSAFIGAATLSMAWFAQIYYNTIAMPVYLMGFLWAFLNFSPGLTSLFAGSIEEFLGKKKAVLFIVISIISGYLLLGIFVSYLGLLFLFYFYFVRGLATPVFKNYINVFSDSGSRATILSIRSLIIRLVFAIIGPCFGYIADHANIQTSLFSAGIFFLINLVIIYFFFARNIYGNTKNS